MISINQPANPSPYNITFKKTTIIPLMHLNLCESFQISCYKHWSPEIDLIRLSVNILWHMVTFYKTQMLGKVDDRILHFTH